MKLTTKLMAFATVLASLVVKAAAHTGDEQDYGPGMMWSDGSWMHNSWHMAGYNMWGMGWLGVLFGLAFWVLVILGIIYLYQQITENRLRTEKEDGE
ncbi:MAG: hypothetical protein ABEJ98_03395 [Candidatus Nanohaloarchaea archaeon]